MSRAATCVSAPCCHTRVHPLQYLFSTGRHEFQHVITGQFEVAAINHPNWGSTWIAMEGFFAKASN